MFGYCGNNPLISVDTTGTKNHYLTITGEPDSESDGYCIGFDAGIGGTSSCSPGDFGTTSGSEPSCYSSYVSDFGTTDCSTSSYYYYSNDYGYGYETVSQSLQRCADIANAAIPGNGHVVGTLKHTIFKNSVLDLGDSSLQTEVSFLNGKKVDYGTKGSIRFDVIQFDSNGMPICAWDFKTGSAWLTEARIRAMLETSGLNIPIFEIR